jgi:outer membrane lipoprotein SlyB
VVYTAYTSHANFFSTPGELKMKKIIAIYTATATMMIISVANAPAYAQRAGQSVTIQYGTVISAREVDLKSGAVPGGALVGGALGLASAGGKSSGKKARNSIIGMAAGGAIAGAAQGSQRGMLYDVNAGASGRIQVVSDQREIRNGDCVSVERAGDTANIRRVSSAYCDKANEPAVRAVANSARTEAEECAAAKQQLLDATTTQEADLASRKIPLLCND